MSFVHRLGLGTVQFGLAYGVSNQNGRVPREHAVAILRKALQAGVTLFDTAPAYGDAEEIVAEALAGEAAATIVTKTLPLAQGLERIVAQARSTFDLYRRPVDLIIHSAADLRSDRGDELWTALLRLKQAGLCRRIGFSAYVEDGVLALARRYSPDFVQAPCSIADQRLLADGSLAALHGLGVEVHVRSIFLQGLQLMEPDRLPAHLSPAKPWLAVVRSRAEVEGMTMLHASLAFAASLEHASRVVIGVTSAAELDEILHLAGSPHDHGVDWSGWRLDDEALLSPARWGELGE